MPIDLTGKYQDISAGDYVSQERRGLHQAVGRFVVIDYRANQGPHKDQPELVVSEEQVTGWTRAAGLGKVEKVDMFPDIYFLVFSR